MKMSLKRMVGVVRVWLGWGDLSTERASPPHGWLLPAPTWLRSQRTPAHREALEKTSADRG
jgi:hypothetical protein